MRGKMHRALIRAVNTDRLGSVSAAGDLGEIGVIGVPRPSASIFFAPRLFPTNKYTHYPISSQLVHTVSLTWELKSKARKRFALVKSSPTKGEERLSLVLERKKPRPKLVSINPFSQS